MMKKEISKKSDASIKELEELEKLTLKFGDSHTKVYLKGKFVYDPTVHPNKLLGTQADYLKFRRLHLKYYGKKNETPEVSEEDSLNRINPSAYRSFLKTRRAERF